MKVIDYLSTWKTAETQSSTQKERRATSDAVVDNTDSQLTTTLWTSNPTKETKFKIPDNVKKIQKELNEFWFVL